jgi:predicted ATPase
VREFGAAVQALTTARVLVLVLEDLQWSDHATLDLITFLARQREPAQPPLVAT